MESDTDEVFYKGQNYKKITKGDLKRGLGARTKKQGSSGIEGKVDVAPFQELLHAKAKLISDNTDEYDEPQKPDYQIFQIIET